MKGPSLPEQFGEYKLVSLLGKGGMASVYRAVKSGLQGFQKEVAIKRIHPSLADNEGILHGLINEARIGGQLKHPNIVEVYEFNKVGEAYYLALEYVDGWTLDKLVLLAREYEMPVPPSVVLEIGLHICEGLDYAHKVKSLDGTEVQLVHRDLKPANIMVSRTGITKLMDFGIAKAATNLFHTAVADVTKGTPHYMSPEQVKGGTVLTGSSDLFSLGSVLYELTTGNVLFTGEALHTVLFNVVKTEVAPYVRRADARVPGIGPLLSQLLAKEPEDRPVDARAVGHWLARLRTEEHSKGLSLRQYMYKLRDRRLIDAGATPRSLDEQERAFIDAGGEPEFATMFAPALEMQEEADRIAEARALADAAIVEGRQGGEHDDAHVDTKGVTLQGTEPDLDEEETAQLFDLPAPAPAALPVPTDQNQKPTRRMPGPTKQMRKAPPKKKGWSVPLLAVAGVLAVLVLGTLGWVVKGALDDGPAPVVVAPDDPTAAPTEVADLNTAGSATPAGRPTAEPRTPRPEPVTRAREPTPASEPSTQAPEPIPEPTPEPTPERVAVVAPATGTGFLSIKKSTPYARVVIDGTDTGKMTPLLRFPLRAGPHDVVLVAVEITGRSKPRHFTLEDEESLKFGHYDFHSDDWSD